MADQKHLTPGNRITIETELNKSSSFKSIARILNKDCTTVSKEIRNHRVYKKTGAFGHPFNNCKHRIGCPQSALCPGCTSKHRKRCSFCPHCMSNCAHYEKEECPHLNKPPYVCNGCSERNKCTLEKVFYSAAYSDKEYRTTLSEARTGENISEEELAVLDSKISPLLNQGQSIHHILASHKDEIMRSEKTIYSYVSKGLFQARNIDMPRKVRLRPRKGARQTFKVDKKCRIGRTIQDFRQFQKDHPDLALTEMDTVEGKKGGAVLLTIHFVQAKLQLSFLRESNDSKSVTDTINNLYQTLGPDDYGKLLSLILTDNGSEFTNPTAIEQDAEGRLRSHVFYCDPSAPAQKGHCENNHMFIRRIIPKGVDIGQYSKEQISLMMDHINSYGRKELGDRSPYEMFSFLYGEDILRKLGVHHIPRDQVRLVPELLSAR